MVDELEAGRSMLGELTAVLESRPALLAAELARRGTEFVVVGGVARWLRDGHGRPRDLDIVVTPGSVTALVTELSGLGVPARAASLLRCRHVHFDTGWGPLDVFVDEDCPGFGPVLVAGVPVSVQVAP